MSFLLLIMILDNSCLQTVRFHLGAWHTSAFRFPCLTQAIGAHGICLHTLLYLHTSRSCLWFVDLHTKLNWRAAALKFHLTLSFTDSDLHCETFSVVLSCLASYGLYSRLGTLSGNAFSACRSHVWLVNNTGDGYSIWGSVFSSPQLLCLPVLETFAITVVNDLRSKFVGGPL